MTKIIKIYHDKLGYLLKNIKYSRHLSMCDQSWNYVQFFPQRNAIGYCCRTSPTELTDEEIQEQGTEIFWNPKNVVERRKQMLSGLRPEDCHVCWKLEINKLQSKRTVVNMVEELRKTHTDIPEDTKLNDSTVDWNSYYTSRSTKVLEIVLGNTCDSKCIYCSDYFSSLWASEKRKYGEDVYLTWENDFDSILTQTFWKYFEEAWPTLPHLNFIGGEPLIIKDFFRYLDKILEIADRVPLNHHIGQPIKKGLSIVTNGNTPTHLLNKFFEYSKKLSNYFDIHVQISGENTEDQLEYVRHGTEWNQWKTTVERYMQTEHIEVQFLPAVNLVSLPSMYRYIDFIIEIYKKYKKNFKLNWASINWPYEINLDVIPLQIIPYIDKSLASLATLREISTEYNQIESLDYFIKSLTLVKNLGLKQNFDMMSDDVWTKKFVLFFNKLDSRRNLNWRETFPEFSQLKDY